MNSPFFSAWLAGEQRALALLPDRFRRREDRAQAVAVASTRQVEPAVHAALVSFNARFEASPARDANLATLARAGTAVVVTGQQVGLFLGPLYTLYKATSAIAAARALAQETGTAVVPIFWLQTEDHDLPEVDHCFVPGRVSLLCGDAATSKVPVAHRVMGPDVLRALTALREALGALPFAAEHLALLEAAYRPEATLGSAFAQVLAALFAPDGLILLDPRDPAISKAGTAVHRKALELAAPISEALADRGRAITKAGFAEQVHIRPGAPLSFVSPEAIDGPRHRLEPAGDGWNAGGTALTTKALLGWLEHEPQRFTTSALLRPLLQDTLLPTAAYVGGPGELAYFAQLAPLYALMQVPMPMLVLRSRFRILERDTRDLLAAVKMTADEVCASRADLDARLAARSGEEPPDALEARLAAALAAQLAGVSARLLALDPKLARPLGQTDRTIRFAFSKLATKYRRALAQKDQPTLEKVGRLRAALVPDGEPQERVFGFPYFACRFGARAFLTLVSAACLPFAAQQEDLTP